MEDQDLNKFRPGDFIYLWWTRIITGISQVSLFMDHNRFLSMDSPTPKFFFSQNLIETVEIDPMAGPPHGPVIPGPQH